MRELAAEDRAKAWRGDEVERFPWSFDCGDAREQRDCALARIMRSVREALETGPGIARMRGLVTHGEGAARARILELGSQLGTPLSQSTEGDLILDVRDRGYAPEDPRFRGPHSRRALRFHSDRCDVIGFYCVRAAAAGGETEVLSSRALYRALYERDPEACATLCATFPYLRHTIDGANPRPFTEMPVFAFREDRFHASLLRVLIDRADADPRAPSLSDAQRHALDLLERVAEDPRLYYRFRLEAGDLLWVDNWTVMHRRRAFEDVEAGAGNGRLLLRLWLSVPFSPAIDERYREHFGATGAGELRGGIRAR